VSNFRRKTEGLFSSARAEHLEKVQRRQKRGSRKMILRVIGELASRINLLVRRGRGGLEEVEGEGAIRRGLSRESTFSPV